MTIFGESSGGCLTQQRLATMCVNWFSLALFPRIRTISIDVNIFKPKVSVTRRFGFEVRGFCESFNPRTFNIEIDKTLTVYDFISTAAHEMVHTRQFARGQLKLHDHHALWMGQEYSYDSECMPWEDEACALETQLANQFIAAHSLPVSEQNQGTTMELYRSQVLDKFW